MASLAHEGVTYVENNNVVLKMHHIHLTVMQVNNSLMRRKNFLVFIRIGLSYRHDCWLRIV